MQQCKQEEKSCLAAQRKREGTTASGRDFGHDYSLSADQQKKRRDAEFKAGLENRTKKEEVEQVDEADSLAAMAARREEASCCTKKEAGKELAMTLVMIMAFLMLKP